MVDGAPLPTTTPKPDYYADDIDTPQRKSRPSERITCPHCGEEFTLHFHHGHGRGVCPNCDYEEDR